MDPVWAEIDLVAEVIALSDLVVTTLTGGKNNKNLPLSFFFISFEREWRSG